MPTQFIFESLQSGTGCQKWNWNIQCEALEFLLFVNNLCHNGHEIYQWFSYYFKFKSNKMM